MDPAGKLRTAVSGLRAFWVFVDHFNLYPTLVLDGSVEELSRELQILQVF